MSADRAGSGRAERASDSAVASPGTDLLSGSTLFILALAYGLGAGGFMDSGDSGVALVPIGLAAALALVSAGIALSGWRRVRQTHVSDATDSGSAGSALPSPRGPVSDSARQHDRATGTGSEVSDEAPDLVEGPGPTRARLWTHRAGPIRAWTVIGLTIIYAALFQALGYILATFLYTAAVAERFGARRRTILLIAPCVTLLIYVLFRVVLGARLPEGLLG